VAADLLKQLLQRKANPWIIGVTRLPAEDIRCERDQAGERKVRAPFHEAGRNVRRGHPQFPAGIMLPRPNKLRGSALQEIAQGHLEFHRHPAVRLETDRGGDRGDSLAAVAWRGVAALPGWLRRRTTALNRAFMSEKLVEQTHEAAFSRKARPM
jgi:hypothetical protein